MTDWMSNAVNISREPTREEIRRAWEETGMPIPALARFLGTTEWQVRQAINDTKEGKQ